MSRFTSKPYPIIKNRVGRALSSNCNIERLYFPQPGDTGIYGGCGRKHFNRRSDTNIISLCQELNEYQLRLFKEKESIMQTKRNALRVDDIDGTRANSYMSEGIKNKMKFHQLRSKMDKQHLNDSLDKGLLEFQGIQYKNTSNSHREENVKERMYTEGDIQLSQPQNSSYKRELDRFTRRLKTNLQNVESLPAKLNFQQPNRALKSRISPTYLSSMMG